MKHNRYNSLVLLALFALVAAVGFGPTVASATTPVPNGAYIQTRVFNDCPSSVLGATNNYPAEIVFDEFENCTGPFANLHIWRFSTDGGATPVDFDNNSTFMFGAEAMIMEGTGGGEFGLQISPWWDKVNEGRLQAKVTKPADPSTGEVAAFGGRLPFYSFTANHGIHYTKGSVIQMQMTYRAHDLSPGYPGSIQYRVAYGGVYDSGELNFDEGNAAEGHGTWGILDGARVGGHHQMFTNLGSPIPGNSTLRTIWRNIFYEFGPVPVAAKSWGKLKAIYQ